MENMKKKSTLRMFPDFGTLDHCERADYLLYIQLHPEVYNHPSPIGPGWMLGDGRCRSVRKRSSDIDGFSSSSDSESDESECFSSGNMLLE